MMGISIYNEASLWSLVYHAWPKGLGVGPSWGARQDDQADFRMDRTDSRRLPTLSPPRLIRRALTLSVLAVVSAILLVWGVFSWCTPHFARADVVGVYVANYPSGTETIELKEDGTFLQEVVLKEASGATPVVRMGTWKFDEETQTLNIPDCCLFAATGISVPPSERIPAASSRLNVSDCSSEQSP